MKRKRQNKCSVIMQILGSGSELDQSRTSLELALATAESLFKDGLTGAWGSFRPHELEVRIWSAEGYTSAFPWRRKKAR